MSPHPATERVRVLRDRLRLRRRLRRTSWLLAAVAFALAAGRGSGSLGVLCAPAALACLVVAWMDRRPPSRRDAARWLDRRQGGLDWQSLEVAAASPFAPLVERGALAGDRGGMPARVSAGPLLIALLAVGVAAVSPWAPGSRAIPHASPEGSAPAPVTTAGEETISEDRPELPPAAASPSPSSPMDPALREAGTPVVGSAPAAAPEAAGERDGAEAVPLLADGDGEGQGRVRIRPPAAQGGDAEGEREEGADAGSGRSERVEGAGPALDPGVAVERSRELVDGEGLEGDAERPLGRERDGVRLEPTPGLPLRLGPLGATRRMLRPTEERYLLRLHQALQRREEGGRR